MKRTCIEYSTNQTIPTRSVARKKKTSQDQQRKSNQCPEETSHRLQIGRTGRHGTALDHLEEGCRRKNWINRLPRVHSCIADACIWHEDDFRIICSISRSTGRGLTQRRWHKEWKKGRNTTQVATNWSSVLSVGKEERTRISSNLLFFSTAANSLITDIPRDGGGAKVGLVRGSGPCWSPL